MYVNTSIALGMIYLRVYKDMNHLSLPLSDAKKDFQPLEICISEEKSQYNGVIVAFL